MKKKLLFMCALLLSCLSINAQWTEPTLTLMKSSEGVPTSGYLYNVGLNMFFTAGATWGTHGAVSDDASIAYLYTFTPNTDDPTAYTLYSEQGYLTNTSRSSGYLGRSTSVDVYVDMTSGNNGINGGSWGAYWTFDANGDYFRIRTSDCDPCYGYNLGDASTNFEYSLYVLGWDPSNYDLDYLGNVTETNEGVYMLDPDLVEENGYEVQWAFVTEDAEALYEAQQKLYNRLVEGTEAGVEESDLSAYGQYTTNSDIDAVNAAYEAVDEIVTNYIFSQGGEDNAVDVTNVIVNPTFEGSTRGGLPDNTYDATDESTDLTATGCWLSTNMVIENNHAYYLYDPETDEVTSEYGLNNFAQNWLSSGSVAASDIHQIIADLPAGHYIMTADCTATAETSTAVVSGCMLYAISGVLTYSLPVAEGFTYDDCFQEESSGSTYAHPRRYSLDFNHFGGNLTIGYGFEPGYANWFAIDNVTLSYMGVVENSGALTLSTYVSTAQMYYEGWDVTYIYSQASYEALGAEIEKAADLMNGDDDDACLTEAEALGELINTVKEDITAYASLASLVEQMNEDIDKYGASSTESLYELSELIADMRDTYEYAYEDKTATTEQISEWVEGYSSYVLDYFREVAMPEATLDDPLDITLLCTNMTFDNSFTGWDLYSETGNSNTTYSTAEVWNSAFYCLQTLENMPAGQYKLTAKAFYRTAGYETAYTEYTAGSADILTKLVLGSSTSNVPNIMVGTLADEPTDASDNGYVEMSSGLWVANSMYSASLEFAAGDTYACSLTNYLIADGDLTFGIRNDGTIEDDAWSIWGDFNLYYYGASSAALYEQLQALMDEAAALDKTASVVAEASEKIEDALTYGGTMTESSSTEDLTAAIEQVQEAMDYANECIDLVTELETEYGLYSERMYSYTDDDGNSLSSNEAYPALIAEIDDAIGNEQFESKAKIEEWLERLVAGWPAYVQYDLLGSTIDDPGDISAAIINPSFDQGTNDTSGATGWTFSYAGDHIGYNSSTQYEGSGYAFEAWNVTSFDMHQTITGLAQGYYRITVNALYRAGNNTDAVAQAYYDDPDEAMDVDFYAVKSAVPVASVYQAASEEDTYGTSASYTYDGTTYYVPNTMTNAGDYFADGLYENTLDVYLEEGQDLTIGLRLARNVVTYNWLVFDDFALFYLGDGEENMPEAVESVPEQADASAQSIYDLSGRKVSKAQKGIYIVNGKKVVIK